MRFEVYQDKRGLWRWRLVAGNQKIAADSGEGYATASNARRAIRRVQDKAPKAHIVMLEMTEVIRDEE